MNSIKINIPAFREITAGLTPEETGIYVTLCNLYVSRGCQPIPYSLIWREIYLWCQGSTESGDIKAINTVINQFVQETDDGWVVEALWMTTED